MVVSLAAFAPWYFQLGGLSMYVACTLIFLVGSGLVLHRLIMGPGALRRFYALFGLAFLGYALAWISCYVGAREVSRWVVLALILGWLGWAVVLTARALRQREVETDLPGLGSAFAYLATGGAFLWFALQVRRPDTLGLLLGTTFMGILLARTFTVPHLAPLASAILFLTNVAGYFSGDWLEHYLLRTRVMPLIGELPTTTAVMAYAMPLWAVSYGLGFGLGLGAAFYLVQSRARAQLRAAP